jgi:hypothetical protein
MDITTLIEQATELAALQEMAVPSPNFIPRCRAFQFAEVTEALKEYQAQNEIDGGRIAVLLNERDALRSALSEAQLALAKEMTGTDALRAELANVREDKRLLGVELDCMKNVYHNHMHDARAELSKARAEIERLKTRPAFGTDEKNCTVGWWCSSCTKARGCSAEWVEGA